MLSYIIVVFRDLRDAECQKLLLVIVKVIFGGYKSSLKARIYVFFYLVSMFIWCILYVEDT